ncbi:MAG: prepilin-type N-terminal cleavage/methylation domain-containing protein [Solirubrobacteraceae bacterium]
MATLTDIRTGEEGLTLVELLVAITLSLVVLLAALQSFDVFTSNAAQQTRATDANDQVRRTMERVVNDLRGASTIVKAEATELVYRVPDSLGHRTERLCLEADDLYGSSSVTAAAPAAAPTTACSTGARLATLKSTTNTAFTYDGVSMSATPKLVKNVGLTFSLDTSSASKPGSSSTLRASAARRSSSGLPITEDDLDTVCNADGALLSLSADVPNVGELTVTYANDGGIAIGIPIITGGWQIPEGITNVVATVTDAAGVTKTIRKGVECSGS